MRVNYVKIAEYSSFVNTQNLKTDFFEAATKGATIFNPHRITVCRNGSFLLDIAAYKLQTPFSFSAWLLADVREGCLRSWKNWP